MKISIRIIFAIILAVTGVLGASSSTILASGEDRYNGSEPQAFNQVLWDEFTKAEDIDKFFNGLTPEEQKVLIEMLTNLKCETVITIEQSRGDLAVTHSKYWTNLGATIYEYHLRIDWSWDGETITQIRDHHSWGVTYWYYQYEQLSESESGGVGDDFFMRWSQGRFWLEIGGWTISTNMHEISMTVTANGGCTSYCN
ncbi:MAG: hypothetical protein PHF74_04470 [Dehalococcoidales bacterium]|nr:hypothetical protein [Dehalococcoidales bacterium]